MDKTYVAFEDLERVINEYECPYTNILDTVQRLSEQDVAREMSVLDLKHIIETKNGVIAVEVWTKQDIRAALSIRNVDVEDYLVSDIAQAVKGFLEDHSDDWNKIQETISEKLKGSEK